MNELLYRLRRKLQIILYDITSAEFMSKFYFLIIMKRRLDLQNPITFNEKIQYYKLYYCPNNALIIECTDKYRIHKYLSDKGLSQYEVPLINVWDNVNDIQWDLLPKRFVLKCNHGCAYNIICKDKETADRRTIVRRLSRWLKEDFGKFNAEPHYSKIPRKVICEEYLDDGCNRPIVDYKVHCFNGEPLFVMICSDRAGNSANYSYYDLQWNMLEFSNTSFLRVQRPPQLDEMVGICRAIGKDFPFVRVDFYLIRGRIYIGELSFDPAGGLDNTINRKADFAIGKMFHL